MMNKENPPRPKGREPLFTWLKGVLLLILLNLWGIGIILADTMELDGLSSTG